jgi:hypothetical protein
MSVYPVDHAGLEALPLGVCLRLLASVPVGRIGFHADGEVVILPVNYVVDGQDVIFRTAAGSKLAAAQDRDHVTFEADGYDERGKSGWSVLVTGRAEPVTEDAEIRRLESLGLRPWGARRRAPVLDPDSPQLGDRAADAHPVALAECRPERAESRLPSMVTAMIVSLC